MYKQDNNVNVKQNPEDFTSNLGRIYSRNNFSAGQGLDTAHRADGQPDDSKRFWDSKGIDVFHGDDEVLIIYIYFIQHLHRINHLVVQIITLHKLLMVMYI